MILFTHLVLVSQEFITFGCQKFWCIILSVFAAQAWLHIVFIVPLSGVMFWWFRFE